MKLRQRMLLVFAATVLGSIVVLFFLSRFLLLASFHELENERMKQDVEYAVTALYQSYPGAFAGDWRRPRGRAVPCSKWKNNSRKHPMPTWAATC